MELKSELQTCDPSFCRMHTRPAAQSVTAKHCPPLPTGSFDEHAAGSNINAPPKTANVEATHEIRARRDRSGTRSARFFTLSFTRGAYHAVKSPSQSWFSGVVSGVVSVQI